MSTPDDKLIYPGKNYANAYEFFSGFGQVSIPFMDGFEIQVVDDTNEDGTENLCFKAAVMSVSALSSASALALAASVFLF